ncbi:hypothetical protein BROUX41_004415 [Berkeleyomyces rouxiae]|uniref:uncharacterized protein n=1 Tax=Berkeleyomyces rouxiae TaxID=2035830 RepID=UPI003B76E765
MHFLNFASATAIPGFVFSIVAGAHPLASDGKPGAPENSPDVVKREGLRLHLDSISLGNGEGSHFNPDFNHYELLGPPPPQNAVSPKSVGSLTSACLDSETDTEFAKGGVRSLIGLDGVEHFALVSCLIHNGYKPISLSSHGNPVEYSSVWVAEAHGNLEYIQDADYVTYSEWLNRKSDDGYVPIFASATGGSTESALFSGVMEYIENQRWTQLCEIADVREVENLAQGFAPHIVDLAIYGDPEDRRYCVLVHQDMYNSQQSTYISTLETPYFFYEYSEIIQQETSKRFWHPTRQYLSENHEFSAVFENTHVGRWQAFQNLKLQEIRSIMADMEAQGLVPVDIQGGGDSKDSTRYNVIFAELTTPKPLLWTAVGDTTGFEDNKGFTTTLDNIMKEFMVVNNVRQLQFSAAVRGTTIAERAYTLGEDDYPVVSVDDPFMIASLSKIFVDAAIDNLIQQGLLDLDTRVYEKLGYEAFADERSRDITVRHLLAHKGGFDRDVSGDPVRDFRQIAIDGNLGRAATLCDVVEYMVDRPLDFTPGTRMAYANYGHMLLSYLVANITRMEYYDFLKTYILGNENVVPYATGAEAHVNDNFLPESHLTGLDPRVVHESVVVPAVYGGDGMIKEETLGTTGLAATASSVARFLGSHAVWDIGGHKYGVRNGDVPGALSFAQCRQDDIDVVILANTRRLEYARGWDYLIEYSVQELFRGFGVKGR